MLVGAVVVSLLLTILLVSIICYWQHRKVCCLYYSSAHTFSCILFSLFFIYWFSLNYKITSSSVHIYGLLIIFTKCNFLDLRSAARNILKGANSYSPILLIIFEYLRILLNPNFIVYYFFLLVEILKESTH